MGTNSSHAVRVLGICDHVPTPRTPLEYDDKHGKTDGEETVIHTNMDSENYRRFNRGIWRICFLQAGYWRLYAVAHNVRIL